MTSLLIVALLRGNTMFGLGGGEIFIVVLLAVILIGPKDLPKVAKTIGRWVRQFKYAANDIKSTLEKEIDIEEESESSKKNSSK